MVIIGNRFSKSTLLITALLHPCSSLVVTPEYKAFLRGHLCHHLQATLLSTWRHLADTQRSAACWYKQERLSIRCRASLCIFFFVYFCISPRQAGLVLIVCEFVYLSTTHHCDCQVTEAGLRGAPIHYAAGKGSSLYFVCEFLYLSQRRADPLCSSKSIPVTEY